MSAQTPVPGLLRSFFEDYLAAQRDVSPNTILAYRDAIKLRDVLQVLSPSPRERRRLSLPMDLS